MGAPESGIQAAGQPSADALLSAFKSIDPAERRRHEHLLDYWLSIRGDKEFPPLHDLDPLQISDAGPSSVLLELAGGGHDAQVRHLGEALTGEARVEQIIDAPSPSVLSAIAKKLPIVAISRDALAFEEEFASGEGTTRCWVTLLPLSAGGAWVDYVYALVSVETNADQAEAAPEPVAEQADEPAATVEEPGEEVVEAAAVEANESDEPLEHAEPVAEAVEEAAEHEESAEVAKPGPGFAKLFDSLAGLTNFYGSEPVKVEAIVAAPQPQAAAEEPFELGPEDQLAEEAPTEEPPSNEIPVEEAPAAQPAAEDVAEEAADVAPVAAEEPEPSQPAPAVEGTLQSKLTEVRAKADEARMAKLRANAALYEGLGAAYDFALDAEDAPEEYLRLVEAQGLKIQLRSPMKPVVKLAFDGLCDDSTIGQLEAVLAWAFAQELPRGSLPQRIEEAGGIARIVSGEAGAA